MTNCHPDLDLITEYAAGSLPLTQSACVSLHLSQCRRCEGFARQLTDLGASLFEAQEPVPVGDALLNSVLARLDEEVPLSYAKNSEDASKTPAILQRLMRGDFSDLNWKNIGSTLRISHLQAGDPQHELAIYHIKAGGRIPEHTHPRQRNDIGTAGWILRRSRQLPPRRFFSSSGVRCACTHSAAIRRLRLSGRAGCTAEIHRLEVPLDEPLS